MRAEALLKANIAGLLRERHLRPHDLAVYCRRSDAWLSKILGKDDRNVPLEYLDRIADFLGVTPFQLFQPGIVGVAERRSGSDRRAGKDRRISALNHRVRESVSAVVANLTAADVADLLRLKGLTDESRGLLRGEALRLERSEHESDVPRVRRRSAEKLSNKATPLEFPTTGRRRREKKPPPPTDPP